ncbi:hypothetical protein [Gandjariella thermophila]|uniref:SMP-30/Gluconolactonase/LRE-like region domain-containing protein n=1 Tax=Gandjariella thermophila TaxID=1931992 RepID=A0A4D4JAD5_9PSEU|nr:hypothetical protein [Gandjariella thermophila]GDY33631.1 hypothetical protein GTS_52640 [Gandjariella thermophila]
MFSKSTRRIGLACGAAVLVGLGVGVPVASGATGDAISVPSGFTTTTFASGGTLSHPDDLTVLGGNVYVAYQNGVGSAGEPSPTGQTASTVVEYTPKGQQVAQWKLTGKVDGMTANATAGNLVATVNEDGNSSLYTITPAAPAAQQVKHYTYSPNPLPHGGGTDSIAVANGALYISASNPSPNADGKTFTKPALYKVTLSGTTATAISVFQDNSTATDAATGKPTTLNLSDPDSNTVMPAAAPRFAGDLLLDSQGDGQLVFLAHPGSSNQAATVLKLNTQVDDTAVATASAGTLYVTDTAANKVIAVHGSFTAGDVFTAVPSDSKALAGTLGQLDLKTGTVSPFGKGFTNPHGLLFVPNS